MGVGIGSSGAARLTRELDREVPSGGLDHAPAMFREAIPLEVAAGVLTPQMLIGQEGGPQPKPEYPPPPPVTPGDVPPRNDKPDSVTIPFGKGDKLVDPALDEKDKWVIVRFRDGNSYKSEDPKTIADAKELKELLKQQAAGLISDVQFSVVISVPGPTVSFTAATYGVG